MLVSWVRVERAVTAVRRGVSHFISFSHYSVILTVIISHLRPIAGSFSIPSLVFIAVLVVVVVVIFPPRTTPLFIISSGNKAPSRVIVILASELIPYGTPSIHIIDLACIMESLSVKISLGCFCFLKESLIRVQVFAEFSSILTPSSHFHCYL